MSFSVRLGVALVAARSIAPALVQISRLIIVRALGTVLRWLLCLCHILARESGCFAVMVSGYTFADGVDSVGDAAVLDASLEETHCCVCYSGGVVCGLKCL